MSIVGRRARPRVERLAAVDAVTLGLDTTRAHVDRPVDARVEELVGSESVVVACGPPRAGTTHVLARAARFLLGDHVLVRPSGPGEPLVDLLERAARAAGHAGHAVVWLDDAPRAALHALADGLTPPPRVRLLVTVREELVDADVVSPGPARRGLASVRVPATGPERPDHPDHLLRALCPRPTGDGRTPLLRAALLRAAVDWDRLAVGLPLVRPTLLAVAADHDVLPAGATTRDELGVALDALLGESPALLRGQRWTSGREADVHHAPAPGLAAAADDLGPTGAGWEVPARLVEELDTRLLSPVDRRAVGVLALRRRADDLALRLLADADPAAVSGAVAYRAGLTALETGRAPEARRWFTVVAGAGAAASRPRAAFWLGLDPDLDVDERRTWLAAVVAQGTAADRADAASVLATLERRAGRAGARRHWLREAVGAARDAGDTRRCADALVELAHLEWTAGSLGEARAAFTEAARCGDPECGAEAMMALGTLAAEQGDDETAGWWYRRVGDGTTTRSGAGSARVTPVPTVPAGAAVPTVPRASAVPSPRRPTSGARHARDLVTRS